MIHTYFLYICLSFYFSVYCKKENCPSADYLCRIKSTLFLTLIRFILPHIMEGQEFWRCVYNRFFNYIVLLLLLLSNGDIIVLKKTFECVSYNQSTIGDNHVSLSLWCFTQDILLTTVERILFRRCFCSKNKANKAYDWTFM